MSIYTELLKLGMADEVASEVADAVRLTKQDLVTKRDLADMEARLTRLILTTMIATTGIFAVFVGAMAWVVRQ